MSDLQFELARFPVHLGLGATAHALPEFEGTPQWYERYGESVAGVGTEFRPR